MGFIRFSGLSILWCGYCVLVGQSLKLMSSSVGLRPSLLTSSPVNYAVRRHSTQYLRAFAPAVAAEAPPTVCVSPFEAIERFCQAWTDPGTSLKISVGIRILA
jgi:hypothetical protein